MTTSCDQSSVVDEAKYKLIHGEGLKILTPKQMLQRLAIVVVQVKAGDTSENVLNEIIYSGKLYILCIKNAKLVKKYTTI